LSCWGLFPWWFSSSYWNNLGNSSWLAWASDFCAKTWRI